MKPPNTVAVSDAGLETIDAATATQAIYSASSVAETIVGPFLVAEKIYSADLLSMQSLWFSIRGVIDKRREV
jgi:hypothetical protein